MKQSSRACGFLVVIESNSGVTKAQSDTAWEKNQMDGGIMEPWLHDRLGKKTSWNCCTIGYFSSSLFFVVWLIVVAKYLYLHDCVEWGCGLGSWDSKFFHRKPGSRTINVIKLTIRKDLKKRGAWSADCSCSTNEQPLPLVIDSD